MANGEEKQKPKKQEPEKQKPAQFLSRVVTAYQDMSDRNYKIAVSEGVLMPLENYLGIITACRGTWQSLGISYNPSPYGMQTMEMAIYFMVPAKSGWGDLIEAYIQEKKGGTISIPVDDEGKPLEAESAPAS